MQSNLMAPSNKTSSQTGYTQTMHLVIRIDRSNKNSQQRIMATYLSEVKDQAMLITLVSQTVELASAEGSAIGLNKPQSRKSTFDMQPNKGNASLIARADTESTWPLLSFSASTASASSTPAASISSLSSLGRRQTKPKLKARSMFPVILP
jgi:hypothetical protein